MKLVVQHNFNTGFGDGVFAMMDYLNTVHDLKEMGFETKLVFNMRGNLYFKSKNQLDYLDRSSFYMFDEIEFTHTPFMNRNEEGYTCVFTHGNANPGAHFWDLFIDDESVNFFEQNYSISQYNMDALINKKPFKVFPKLVDEILIKYDEFIKENNIGEFDAIYYRTQDLQEELDFLEKNKPELMRILETDKRLFICSNGIEFKNYIKSFNKPNVFFWDIPLGESIGGNHLEHYKVDPDVLHQRCIYTLLDMWTLGNAKEIHFFTTWGRYSNFLFYAPIVNCERIFYK